MALSGKFGQARLVPDGQWVRATLAVKVAGIHYRKNDVFTFAHAVKNAEHNKLPYGVTIIPEPDNPHDPNALKVYGWAVYKPILRSVRKLEWHIGYVDAETAAFVQEKLVQRGVPIAAELYSIYVGIEDFIDVTIFVLAPPGNSLSTLVRSRK